MDFILNYDIQSRLGSDAPGQLSALGNFDLLALPKAALFCSTRCPGDAILRAYDKAAQWRDAGRRATTALAERRNELVAALADEAVIIHATPGGHIARLSEQLQQWGIRVVHVVGG